MACRDRLREKKKKKKIDGMRAKVEFTKLWFLRLDLLPFYRH